MGRTTDKLAPEMEKKIGRTRFVLPGFARRKIPEIARKATPQTQASIHAESLKKPIQPVLPIFRCDH